MIVKRDREILQNYLSDASNYRGNAEIVYIPQNLQEVKEIISKLYQEKTPITISGAGTGLTGGRVPNEGVILSMEYLNKIIEINYSKRLVRVQPGLLLSELEKELNFHGYFFPPNPTEINSSIGGNISNNASGSRTFKYGSYRKFVRELTVILSNGDKLVLDNSNNYLKNNELKLVSEEGDIYLVPVKPVKLPDTKNAAGYYLSENMTDVDLFVGSEGTLGVVVEAVLEFLKMPERIAGFMTFFDNVDNMLNYVEKVRKLSLLNNKKDYASVKEISASLIELFDKNALNLIRNKYPQIPENAKSCIWTEQEYSAENEEYVLGSWFDIIKEFTQLADSTWVSLNEKEHKKFREFRHAIPSKVVDLVARNNFKKYGTDTAVPVEKFREFYTFVVDNFESSGIEYVIWGHVGNAHLHANLLPQTVNEFEKSRELFNLVLYKAVELGGTISGEHGIGKLKKEYMHLMFGNDDIDAMKVIRRALDSHNLLGRGNLFD
jgi:D-lactate dehydrogenase (cytochrome)